MHNSVSKIAQLYIHKMYTLFNYLSDAILLLLKGELFIVLLYIY